MKAIQISRKGAPDTLEYVDLKKPVAEAGEVLIRVEACGVNFADVLARQGLYPDAPALPFIPGYEVAGTVVLAGSKTQTLKTGDRVTAFTRFGGYAEYAAAEHMAVLPLPDSITFTDAAGFPVIFTTAYHCLFQTGPFLPGFKVLIHAAAGGVGQAAVQLCKLHDCTIFGTTGSPEKIQVLSELGVHYPINYNRLDFASEIRKIVPGPPGLDIILDCIGGETIKKGLSLLKPGGRIVTFGVAGISGKNMLRIAWTVFRTKRIHPIGLMARSRGIFGVNILHVFDQNPALALDSFQAVHRLLVEEKIKSPVTKILPLSQAAQAHSMLQNRMVTGKIVLVPGK